MAYESVIDRGRIRILLKKLAMLKLHMMHYHCRKEIPFSTADVPCGGALSVCQWENLPLFTSGNKMAEHESIKSNEHSGYIFTGIRINIFNQSSNCYIKEKQNIQLFSLQLLPFQIFVDCIPIFEDRFRT